MEPKTEFGRLLRDARRAARWTLAKLADETGFSRGTLSKIENGVYDRPPSDRLIDALSRALGMERGSLIEARNAYIPSALAGHDSTASARADRDRALEAFYVDASASALSLLSDPPLDRTLAEAVSELVRAAQRGLDAHQPSAAKVLLELATQLTHSKLGGAASVTGLEIRMLSSLARSRLRSREAWIADTGSRPDTDHFEEVLEIGQCLAVAHGMAHGASYSWFLVLKELGSFAARFVFKATTNHSLEPVLSWPQVNADFLAVAISERFIVVEPRLVEARTEGAPEGIRLDEALIRRRIVAEAEVALSLFRAAIELEPLPLVGSDQLRGILREARWEIERAIVMRVVVRLQARLVSGGYSVHPDNQETYGWCEDTMRQTILGVRQSARSLGIEEQVLEARSFLAYAHLELGFLLRTRGDEPQDLLGAFWNFTLASRLDQLFDQYVRVQLKEIWAALSGNHNEYIRLEREIERKLSASNIETFDYDF